MRGEVSETLRDVAKFEKPYETDDEIPYARHEVGPLSHLTAVFVKGDVPYPVQSVLDLPMTPVEGKDPLRIVFKARNPVSCFRAPGNDAPSLANPREEALLLLRG